MEWKAGAYPASTSARLTKFFKFLKLQMMKKLIYAIGVSLFLAFMAFHVTTSFTNPYWGVSVEALAQGTGSGGSDDCPTCVENQILEYKWCIGGTLTWEDGKLVCKLWTGNKADCNEQSGATCDQAQQTGYNCNDFPE